ncbi:hypothetical protein [Zhenpiania hominis]|uniref:Uncharacterized protein n=1 Tax=Zhenpiania hominis TaxID=2763644 RepID=A0A923SQE3_9FIRM|nr:hypothetical protein [Zhenpiania hominis]MBC6679542.1 hypothetical protein [Zhenpiania hominis]
MDKIILEKGWDLSAYSGLCSYGKTLFNTGTLSTYFCAKQDWNTYRFLLQELHLKQLEGVDFHGRETFEERINKLKGIDEISILKKLFKLICMPGWLSEKIAYIYSWEQIDYAWKGFTQPMDPEKRKRLKEVVRELELLEADDTLPMGEKAIRRNNLKAEKKYLNDGPSYYPMRRKKTGDKIYKTCFEDHISRLIMRELRKYKNGEPIPNTPSSCLSEEKGEALVTNQFLKETILHDEPQKKKEKAILYVHGGLIQCLKEKHPIESRKAKVYTIRGIVELNINYCQKCSIHFISIDELRYYLKKYQAIFTDFRWIEENSAREDVINYSSQIHQSPLYLCGYTVDSKIGLDASTRQNILSKIIDFEILKKYEIIQYLDFFIKRNGAIQANKFAKEKWKSDIEFVRSYHFETQQEVCIKQIKRIQKKR